MCVSGVKAVQWGVQCEDTAVRIFTEQTGKQVNKTGLWLHRSGVLGASPDGILPDESAIVEVKCPYSCRNLTIKETAAKPSTCLKLDGEAVSMKEDHEYYHQVQGQIYLTNSVKGYLLVYTTAELGIIEIQKDDNWAPNLDILAKFYFSHMLPLIISGDHDTVMPASK